MCNWADTYLDEGMADRFCVRYTEMIYRLDRSFERPQCAFFDPDVRFGGPNPDESMSGQTHSKNPNAKNPTKSRRLRRSDDDVNVCDGMSETECDDEAMAGLECSDEDKADRKYNPYITIGYASTILCVAFLIVILLYFNCLYFYTLIVYTFVPDRNIHQN